MEERDNEPLHVVLGAGQVGSRLAQLLLARGARVRLVRHGAAAAPAGIELQRGDIRDPAFAARVGQGASVVYDCMNPQYHQWHERLLPLGQGSLNAARASGARLVALDNLYMYGRPDGAMREDSPRNPCSRKGALRVELEQLRMAAQQRGEVEVAILRASDFVGRDVQQSAFSDRFFRNAFAGKPVECFGDPDLPHSYTYVDDVVSTLALLGTRPEAFGQVWHAPTPPAESTRALNARIGRALGLDVETKRVPKWLLRGVGVFQPLVREMVEMMYQWEVPYVIDDQKIRHTFGVTHTPVDTLCQEMASWARAHYGKGEARSQAHAS